MGVGMNKKDIRKLFRTMGYEDAVATDVRAFPSMTNPDDPKRTERMASYEAWATKPLSEKTQFALLPPNSKSGFDAVRARLDADSSKVGVMVAECSNFAYHAISVLLSNKEITDEYNVCLAGIGPLQNHNVVVLFPKDGPPFGDPGFKSDKVLIFDPWAMAMGFGPTECLAAKPTKYIYPAMLANVTLGYQSMTDPEFNPGASRPAPTAHLRHVTPNAARAASAPAATTEATPDPRARLRHVTPDAARPATAPAATTQARAVATPAAAPVARPVTAPTASTSQTRPAVTSAPARPATAPTPSTTSERPAVSARIAALQRELGSALPGGSPNSVQEYRARLPREDAPAPLSPVGPRR